MACAVDVNDSECKLVCVDVDMIGSLATRGGS